MRRRIKWIAMNGAAGALAGLGIAGYEWAGNLFRFWTGLMVVLWTFAAGIWTSLAAFDLPLEKPAIQSPAPRWLRISYDLGLTIALVSAGWTWTGAALLYTCIVSEWALAVISELKVKPK